MAGKKQIFKVGDDVVFKASTYLTSWKSYGFHLDKSYKIKSIERHDAKLECNDKSINSTVYTAGMEYLEYDEKVVEAKLNKLFGTKSYVPDP